MRKLLHKIFDSHKVGGKLKINKNWRGLAETPSAIDLLKRKEKILKIN